MESNGQIKRPLTMPVTNVLNAFLVGVVFLSSMALLWLGSHVSTWYQTLLVGIVFSYVLLTNYALLHEASHNNLNSNPRINYLLGMIAGMLFPMPISMIQVTHGGHHLRNRTDHEMFDMYYPTDSRLLRILQWYSILCGLFWPVIPLGAVLFALCPAVLRIKLFRRERSSSYLLGDIRDAEVSRIRWEVALIVGFFAGAFWLLRLDWKSVLLMYACFSFNWSTRQYIGHAFSKRDVIEGAWNLRHNSFMTWLLLHGEYDLSHHRHPEVPWYYLPMICPATDPRPSYAWQYWRQWLGPKQVEEPAPESLQTLPLSVHESANELSDSFP